MCGVPTRLLLRSVMPGGHRLPKKPELKREAQGSFLPQWYRGEPTVGSCSNIVSHTVSQIRRTFTDWNAAFKTQRQREAERGNGFGNDEYRFWIESEHGSLSLCRACRKSAYSAAERRAHLTECGCAKRLVDAYGFLLDAKEPHCVVCNSAVHTKIWGVPMCGNKFCIDRWKHSFHQWEDLVKALVWARALEQERAI